MFSGFSADDIQRISTPQEKLHRENGVGSGNKSASALKKIGLKPKGSNQQPVKTKPISNWKTPFDVNQIEAVPDSAKLSFSITATNNMNPTPDILPATVVPENLTETTDDTTARNGTNNNNDNQVLITKNLEINVDADLTKKYRDLDEFEIKQKLIEEQNRRRKELLSKALADRTKQTQEEAQRLNEIREEFKKLDAMLSNDVKILRKQIEVASIDYTDTQKRYMKIEREYLEAKLLMQQKLEKKEMLTEHLCTIIEKNEERKAEKLNELLEKLQLNPQLDRKDDDSAPN